ncbi:MAG: L-2-amino-thiazoline-4-carboxylic acid hydrolase [Trueperaceae bacterium]|nr:L-2-amino-thiazoline-4-carboxylic acid hydrolase [Trueperaceae bacterium]
MNKDNLNERVGVLTRREIEARILKPFYEVVAAELGEEKARALLSSVVIAEAKNLGQSMRAEVETDELAAFAEQWEPWFRGGALVVEVLEQNEKFWNFNVTRCRYAELYRELGMAELGATLSCNRDAALVEGYSQDIAFERSQTLMQGASHCDFRYRKNSP